MTYLSFLPLLCRSIDIFVYIRGHNYILIHPKICCVLYKTRVLASAEASGQGPGMNLARSQYAAKACVLSRLLQGQMVSVTTYLLVLARGE